MSDNKKNVDKSPQDLQIKQKLQLLKNRFAGAIEFLNKTTIKKDNKVLKLNQLPWCLLIGPENAGKTTLLANAGVNFTLQKQFQQQDLHHLEPSENCDWWVTREISFIDVPGKYFSSPDPFHKKIDSTIFWRLFLRLTKENRGKRGLNSIIIALPLPELLKQTESPQYLMMQRNIFKNLSYLQSFFPTPIACHIMITKCDLLPGFTEFFSELANDEITQAWGITLPNKTNNHKIHEIANDRFNALIKKLNQQLLYRLHHERNPIDRVKIKDFPLQLEQLKEQLLNFIKNFAAGNFNLSLQTICLTSAIQKTTEEEQTILDESIYSAQKQVQIFSEVKAISRAYFIKHLISQGIISTPTNLPEPKPLPLKRKFLYASSIVAASLIAILLITDFKQSSSLSHQTQNLLLTYQHDISQLHNTNARLETTLTLLNLLQQSANDSLSLKAKILNLFTLYSHKTHENLTLVYQQALRNYLLPEFKEYLEDNLKLPVNRDAKLVYDTLKTYLMLGNTSHFQEKFFLDTMDQLLGKSISPEKSQQANIHLKELFKSGWQPLTLNNNIISETRKYLTSIPGARLGYIILKNFDNNSSLNKIDLCSNNKKFQVFDPQSIDTSIAKMFTASEFSIIYSKEIPIAIAEITSGNWVLNNNNEQNNLLNNKLVEQLRNTYINHYTIAWEKLLTGVNLSNASSLKDLDAKIVSITGNYSPLLQLLQTIRLNTAFNPIMNSSEKLRNINILLEDENNKNENRLYQIFYGLQSLHKYLLVALNSSDVRKASFDIISNRMKNLGAPDAILQLRLIASKSPEPIKSWLDTIANNAWYFLVQEASHYLDMSWQNQVVRYYQTDIANRYPFGAGTTQEVSLDKFIKFFGTHGTIKQFYSQYLENLIDTSNPEWQWKLIDNEKLPFSNETLRQIQLALLIQQIFFPNGDDKPHLRFAIQPFKFGEQINSVKLNINNKEITDTANKLTVSHPLEWPEKLKQPGNISIQITTKDAKIMNQNYPGYWGWFKLVNQSFENVITHKQMLLNFSMKNQPTKYILHVQDRLNPFLALNLGHFSLPKQLLEKQQA